MACTCHQKDGVSVLVTKPDDQCTACARKHVRNAWTAWGEFCYEDTNRDYVSGQLRAAADHLKYDHRPEALHCRDLAALIEDVRDASPSVVSEQLCVLLDKVRELFYNDHPQSRQRLFELGAETDGTADLLVPLWAGAREPHDELRILLRSAEKNLTHLGRVIVVTTNPPKWLRNAVVVPVSDDTRIKDANMLDKVIKAVEVMSIKRFVLAADDNVFLSPVDARKIPVLRIDAPRSSYDKPENGWFMRVCDTYDYWAMMGLPLNCNYEAHCPQTFLSADFMGKIQQVPYHEGRGLTIYTCLRMCGGRVTGTDCRPYVVSCAKKEAANSPLDKTFCVYMDEAFNNGLRERLFERFPEKSRFEA